MARTLHYFLQFVLTLPLFLLAWLFSALTVANVGGIPWLPYVLFLGGVAFIASRIVKDRPSNTSGEAWEGKGISVEEVFEKEC